MNATLRPLTTLALLTVVSALTMACSGADADEDEAADQTSEALREQCDISNIAHYLVPNRQAGDKFKCIIDPIAEMIPPSECTRRYTVTLFNGSQTSILDKDTCRNCSHRDGVPLDGGLYANDGGVVKIPRGQTITRVALFEDEFSDDKEKLNLSFTCPVQCSAPDDC